MSPLSPRLAAVVDALPLRPGMRVLEIGGGPGAAAKEVAMRVGRGHILMIDRSAKSVALASSSAAEVIAAGRMSVRHVAVEDFALAEGEEPFDLAFGIRVGALDGRRPELTGSALQRIANALAPGGRLFIDGGTPLREIRLPQSSPRFAV